ncbi:SPOR domain-containing protein [Gemmobacter nectariphilus]|uniref:SPOR domain-containing protein n=1 Tax=Gemmobacter nectariphilus TaxID=220343 RepID=UPI0003FC2D9A|nr:SPOR domain-containing protein [Gemmobacter nectariphilus]
MLLKFLPVALVAAAATANIAHAQGRPPAELPPAGFSGQQYVDSRGCLYVRAGYGGQTNWVARIDRARNPICGQTPSVTAMAQAQRQLATPEPVPAAPAPVAMAAAPVPVAAAPRAVRGAAVAPSQYVPPPVTYGKPTPLRAAAPVVAAAPPAVAAPRAVVAAPAPVPVAPRGPVLAGDAPPFSLGGHPPLVDRSRGCPERTPYGHFYRLRDGRTLLLCSNSPRPVPNVELAGVPGHPVAAGPVVRVATSDLMTPPAGYKAAWTDDRLNPNRALGTAEGDQRMRQVWTDRVPQKLRDPAYARPQHAAASSKTDAAPAAAGGARFVQVGSFGVPQNASRAAAQLQALGMPVQVSRGAIKGKPVQIVRAGPFASDGQAVAALQAARGAGFGDAILRR